MVSGQSGTRTMKAKAVDYALAASALHWAVSLMGGLGAPGRAIPMDLSVVVLDLTVAGLFVIRQPVAQRASPAGVALAVGTVVAAAAALSLGQPGGRPWWAQMLFVAGALGAALSLGQLGRSFAVLPASRVTVRHGAYGLVRHPAYACELLMLAGAVGSVGGWAWVAAAAVAALQVARLEHEERLLGRDPAYQSYRRQVRFRLLPGVY